MTIPEIQNTIIKEFEPYSDLSKKYKYLISLAKQAEPLDAQYKRESNLIKGCQSLLWINVEIKEGKMIIKGETDVMITMGILSLILRVYNGKTPFEIATSELFFIEKIGLKQSLSPQRATGVKTMIEHIKKIAKAAIAE